MNYKVLVFSALCSSMMLTVGCASNTDPSAGATSSSQVEIDEPSVQMTVVANSLSAWPYRKQHLTYTIKNKDATEAVNAKADVLESWKAIAKNGIASNLNNLGLRQVESNPRLVVTFGVSAPAQDDVASDAVFDNLGLTPGSKDGFIDVSITDNRSGFTIWSGAVSGTVDKPIKTEKQKRRVIYSLLESLFRKLPAAD